MQVQRYYTHTHTHTPNGQGMPQDYAQARDWYLKAAEQGDAFGQNGLGLLYAYGRGVPQNYVQARDWYLKAAEQGDAFAQSNLGSLYHNVLWSN